LFANPGRADLAGAGSAPERHAGSARLPQTAAANPTERGDAMAGLYFEDFAEGQLFEHATGRTVTEMDNVLFSALTMNPQPLHLDAEFAKNTEFGQRLVNSLFTLGLVIGISVGETTLGTTIANLGMSEVRFPKPVFHGDTLRARTIIRAKRMSRSRTDAGIVEFEHQGINQRGETVMVCRRAGLMKCRPAEG
jgi:acyl dehydratase